MHSSRRADLARVLSFLSSRLLDQVFRHWSPSAGTREDRPGLRRFLVRLTTLSAVRGNPGGGSARRASTAFPPRVAAITGSQTRRSGSVKECPLSRILRGRSEERR